MSFLPSHLELASLLLLPLLAYIFGAMVISLLEKQFTKAPPHLQQDGL
ncbi:hypothetical protein P2G88_18850 [Aliiglaciecola sp. CAU 1673]|nr:hypothetical protein [Aliiglaciecola sp. CAU 1673]MDF2180321.1 hypothetical protein [Aliiglaciecola sp. CAU 1673]